MCKKRKGRLVVAIAIFIFPFTMVSATEVQQVETTGTIGFTGVYEPIGTPDPTPPESIVRPPITEVAKPDGTLPQTNELSHPGFIWLGILILSMVFLLWIRRKKEKKPKTIRK